MLTSIWEDIKRQFSSGNMVTRLILLNVIVFVVVSLVGALMMNLSGSSKSVFIIIEEQLQLPTNVIQILKQPWSILTHMFMHASIGHIFWNMIIYFWIGRIFGDLLGDKRVLPIYLLSGLAGAVLAVLFWTITGRPDTYMLGASAAVMGTLTAIAVTAPDYELNLLLLGRVPLKYIAMALIVIDLIALGGSSNTGGHLAHLGGVAFGWVFALQLQQGNDIAAFLSRWIESISNFFSGQSEKRSSRNNKASRARSPLRVSHRSEGTSQQQSAEVSDTEERLNRILDKIHQRGIDSLSPEEKEFLESSSKK